MIDPGRGDPQPPPERGVYGITVAAELSGATIQSIRFWERRGLLTPARTDGGTRRYSARDLHRIRRITDLVADGVNIAGITHILELEDANAILRNAASGDGEYPSARMESTRPGAYFRRRREIVQSDDPGPPRNSPHGKG